MVQMAGIENLFQPISDAFFWLLQLLHANLGISWSWSIVVLTLIIRTVLIPLTWRQIKSMRAMQVLQPQIQALQEKYKDNRELLSQKTMEFYQENKVSPFGSCLPLLLQMPVFMGLYYMLREQGQAGGAFFSPNPTVSFLWIADITKFDLILMFLYIASQFLASWQTARKGVGQQKVIAYFMPVMIGIFMFIGKWPAGLFIYWVTSNLWTIAQQFVLEKVVPTPAPTAAAKETTKLNLARPPGTTQGKTTSEITKRQGQATSDTSKRPNRGAKSPKGAGQT